MTTNKLRPPALTLLTLLALGGSGTMAQAAPQLAARVQISATDYPHARCNDGTPATYYVRGGGPDGAISGRKWLIFLHGGGKCSSDASCAERWHDPNAGNDGTIGYHGNMTASTEPTNDFNGKGILDFDGVDPPPANAAGPGTNPFVGFNRIMVPYCSSDAWSGRNSASRPFDSAPFVVPGSPGSQIPPLTSIRFSGRHIAEAVTDLLMRGGIKTGRKVNDTTADRVEPPATASDEVVISGSSAGGTGVTRNLDNLAKIVRDAAAPVQVLGIIDAADTVGVLPDASITGDPDFAIATYHGATGADEVDTSCQAVYPLGASNRCFSSMVVLKQFIETPHYVVQQAYDGVSHSQLKEIIAQQLALSVTAAQADSLAERYVRNQISTGALGLGGGLANPQHLGYFIPNYLAPHHQLMAEDEWFFNTPAAKYDGNNPRLSADATSTLGLPRGLACFRFKVSGQGSGCVDAGDAKVINSTYPTNPLTARFDPQTSTLTLPFVMLSNGAAYQNVTVTLNPLGAVVVNDPAVGGLGTPNGYNVSTNVLTLPSVTVGSSTYERVRVTGPGIRVLGYEAATF